MTRALEAACASSLPLAAQPGAAPAAALAGGDWLAALDFDPAIPVDASAPSTARGDAPLTGEASSEPRERGRRFQDALAIEWSVLAAAMASAAPTSDAPVLVPTEDGEAQDDANAADEIAEIAASGDAARAIAPGNEDASALSGATTVAPDTTKASAPKPRALPRDPAHSPPASEIPSEATAPLEATWAAAVAGDRSESQPTLLPHDITSIDGQANAEAALIVERRRSWTLEGSDRLTVEVGGSHAHEDNLTSTRANANSGASADTDVESLGPVALTTSELLDVHRVAHEPPTERSTSRHEAAANALATTTRDDDAIRQPMAEKSVHAVTNEAPLPASADATTTANAVAADAQRADPIASDADTPTPSASREANAAPARDGRKNDRDFGVADTRPGAARGRVVRLAALDSNRDGTTSDGDTHPHDPAPAETSPASHRTGGRKLDATDVSVGRPAAPIASELDTTGAPAAEATGHERPAHPERAAPNTEHATPDLTRTDADPPRTLRMTLEPPEGGSVEVRLEVRGEAVHAHIVTSDAGLGTSLSSGRDDLREHLRQQHLDLAHLDVSSGAGHSGHSSQHDEGGRQPGDAQRDDARTSVTNVGRSARGVLSPSTRSATSGDGTRTLDVRV